MKCEIRMTFTGSIEQLQDMEAILKMVSLMSEAYGIPPVEALKNVVALVYAAKDKS